MNTKPVLIELFVALCLIIFATAAIAALVAFGASIACGGG